jgi:signal transduction histidine kinase
VRTAERTSPRRRPAPVLPALARGYGARVPSPAARVVVVVGSALPALLVAGLNVLGTWGAAVDQPTARPLDALGTALLAGAGLLLAARRWFPAGVLVATAATAVLYLGLGYPFGPVFAAPLLALCSAVLAGRRRVAYPATAVAVAALTVVHVLRNPGAVPLAGVAGWVAALAAVVAGCEWWRARRERAASAAAAREQTALRRRSDERLRIARELHDVLGHHVSLINVQAGVALYLLDDDPEQARTALTAIKQASRDLLREMRSTLGVLRAVDAVDGPAGEPPHHPVPGLTDLDALLADVRAAGLPVQLRVAGDRAALPPAVDRAAYRVVQEALTNVRRHAGDATATVLLDHRDDALVVVVDDDGRGAAPGGDGGGNGVAGMAERAAALGGSSSIGPRPGGGYRVRVELPLRPAGPGGAR